jgi:hypothetical protein
MDPSLTADILSANLITCFYKIGQKGYISSQNVSFYLQIQYLRSKIPQITRPTCTHVFLIRCETESVAYLDQLSCVTILWSILTTVNRASFFEAFGAILNICLSLKPNHHYQV